MSDVAETLKQRGSIYGTIESNSMITQDFMRVINHHAMLHGTVLSEVHKECLHMIVHKIGRMICGDPMYPDNPHDIAGYAKLLEDWILEQTV
jgi:hypothetical protein